MEYNVHQVRRFKWTQCLSAPFYYVLLLSLCSSSPQSALATCSGSSLMHHMNLRPNPELLRRQTSNTPLVITNQCKESIYPGILTQSGVGPGTGGFGLAPGAQRVLTVSEAWQGRVWGRTNCSFNSAGDGPTSSTSNGQACGTGDCGGIMDCRGTVSQSIPSPGADPMAHFWSARESSQSVSPNSRSTPAVVRLSMTFHLSTDTTFQWPSFFVQKATNLFKPSHPISPIRLASAVSEISLLRASIPTILAPGHFSGPTRRIRCPLTRKSHPVRFQPGVLRILR